MRAPSLLLLALLLAPSAAHADLGGRKAGVWADVGGGLGGAGRPFEAGVGVTAAVGGWFGRYDESFSIGRRVDVGVRLRGDVLLGDAVRTAPMLEVRRGIDLIVVALRFGGTAGPLFVTPLGETGPTAVGATVRADGAVGWRFDRAASLMLRLDAGIDVVGKRVDPVLGLTLGIEVAVPARRKGA